MQVTGQFLVAMRIASSLELREAAPSGLPVRAAIALR